jgi:hypothetical protein
MAQQLNDSFALGCVKTPSPSRSIFPITETPSSVTNLFELFELSVQSSTRAPIVLRPFSGSYSHQRVNGASQLVRATGEILSTIISPPTGRQLRMALRQMPIVNALLRIAKTAPIFKYYIRHYNSDSFPYCEHSSQNLLDRRKFIRRKP